MHYYALIFFSCVPLFCYCQREEVNTYIPIVIKEIKISPVFTQGLFFDPNDSEYLYQSSGLYAKSLIRKVNLKTGFVQKHLNIPIVFAEGSTFLNNSIYLLTWKAEKVFVLNTDFEQKKVFEHRGEGWGITAISNELWVSDGTSKLKIYNENWKLLKEVQILYDNNPIELINELEYVPPYLYANIWFKSLIIMVDISKKIQNNKLHVSGVIQCQKLIQTQNAKSKLSKESTVNGIAYHHNSKGLYLTGKNWNTIYQIKLKQVY